MFSLTGCLAIHSHSRRDCRRLNWRALLLRYRRGCVCRVSLGLGRRKRLGQLRLSDLWLWLGLLSFKKTEHTIYTRKFC